MGMNARSGVVVEGIGKAFDDVAAVVDLSFVAEPGEILGLLGPNGAGKTTAIRMLTTLLSIDQGSATVAGIDVATDPETVRRVVGLAGQSAAVDEKLTAVENLDLFARLYKLPKGLRVERCDRLIQRLDLGEFADRTADTYSGGQRRRLDLAVSLVAAPPVVFLDEPTTGLDPTTRKELWNEVGDLRDAGATVVLTTQYLDEADQLSDRIVIIDRGVVTASGTSDDLKAELRGDVLEIHLAEPDDLQRAERILGDAALEPPADRTPNALIIPMPRGAQESLVALRRLDDADVAIVDFRLRKPTLDDVFQTMTGGQP